VTAAGAFSGIPAEAFDFYDGLEADNSKTYWTAQRAVYDACVRGPLTAMLAALEPEFGPGVVFRPYRDVRFSKSKLPYKDHQGAFVEAADAVGYYVQVNAEGLHVAGGWYDPAGPQLARYREIVAGPAGAELERVVGTVTGAGFELGGDRLKTRPRGVDPDHPRLQLLRHRSVVASRSWPAEGWMSEPSTLLVVRDAWRSLAPLVEWLAASVGPGDPERHRR
jgi:uncharacterized protein (TIGR02453 family)